MTYFSQVRSYECFKYLHQGIISPIKRKSLPEIAKVVGISSHQQDTFAKLFLARAYYQQALDINIEYGDRFF